MISRRTAVRWIASASAAATHPGFFSAARNIFADAKDDPAPALAAGAPTSPERLALIETFRKQSDGLDKKFEARSQKDDWTMLYRLFHPETKGKLPLVVYLHGSGGQGTDNLKQLALGNIFGTRVWLLPGNQKAFPCYVLAPQSDRGWVRYDPAKLEKGEFEMVPGEGQGVGMVLKTIDALIREFPIDENRIYAMGQSMGGAGTWNLIASRPKFFAAAVTCCGSISKDDGTASIQTPLWNFHGDADGTVPISLSRDRIAARRKAGGHPLSTEYAGVDHNVWEWAFTEPALVKWLFAQRRA